MVDVMEIKKAEKRLLSYVLEDDEKDQLQLQTIVKIVIVSPMPRIQYSAVYQMWHNSTKSSKYSGTKNSTKNSTQSANIRCIYTVHNCGEKPFTCHCTDGVVFTLQISENNVSA